VAAVNPAGELRQLLAGTAEKALVFPGVGTPLEALSAEAAGFPVIYLSGYGVAAWRHGLPDIGLLGARDTAEALTAVTRVTSVPVIVDADTGYGDAASVHSTVRLLEAAGAAAIQFEDQAWPKKCGHMSDKEVIDADDAVRKIEAAVAARTNPDTVIIARTDAIGPLGIDEALRRARRFSDAGADVLFVDAPQSLAHLRAIGSQVAGPIMVNMSEGGRTPMLSASELHALGFGLVVFPASALFVAARAIRQLFEDLKAHGDTGSWRDRMYGLDELNELVRLDDYDRIGRLGTV
jgi:2-methylisocitrate lyase-like PEP mutase family enzyme